MPSSRSRDPRGSSRWSKTYPANTALPLGLIELTTFLLYFIPKSRYLGDLRIGSSVKRGRGESLRAS
ncbi:hypothetical protein [Limnoglobus roseus]|uniref:hypothetical protein n=1 Tax=Limnoglobus roseus TaxID=2598579 RepID=UPI0015B4FF3A|nr:hypothetical protein [Limnoglobus roseus]